MAYLSSEVDLVILLQRFPFFLADGRNLKCPRSPHLEVRGVLQLVSEFATANKRVQPTSCAGYRMEYHGQRARLTR